MINLNIEVVQNGFIASEKKSIKYGLKGVTWTFSSPESLSLFVKKWADMQKISNALENLDQ